MHQPLIGVEFGESPKSWEAWTIRWRVSHLSNVDRDWHLIRTRHLITVCDVRIAWIHLRPWTSQWTLGTFSATYKSRFPTCFRIVFPSLYFRFHPWTIYVKVGWCFQKMFKWFAPRIVRQFGLTFVQLEDDEPPLDDPRVILVLWRSFLLLVFNWGNPNTPPPLKKQQRALKDRWKTCWLHFVQRIRDSDIVWFNQ